MNFIQMVESLENGHNCKRLDWGYPESATIFLEEFNNNHQFYIKGEYATQPEMIAGYGITYADIKSSKWSIQNK